ncbi:MAG: rod shape-determining protein RodA [Deltaproteobacteria bacterium]|nr:rod shape-determining protein RodA [Deltaproteobacteria bacterium]
MFDRRLIQNIDWLLLLVLIIIAGISLLNLYSATYPIRDVGGAQIFTKQVYWFFTGFFVFLLMTTFNYFALERIAYPAYILSLILLVLVIVIGKVTCGSQRWLSLGLFSFQPSELEKIVILIVFAKFFSEKGGFQKYRLRDLWQPFLILSMPFLLILKQPDLGTALLIVAMSFSIFFFVNVYWKSMVILVGSAIAVAPLVWFNLKEYQQARILTFIRPEMDPLGAGYHINQSKIAIGSGLFWGKGFLKGTQTRLNFLPEQHTDFAFSVLAEEWGFLGAIILLMLYLFLILCGLSIARNSKDKFGSILAVGIVSMFFWQVVINVGMVAGLLPVVGIPLPLFSYGGSSLITTMASIGLLMNIRMRRFMFSA